MLVTYIVFQIANCVVDVLIIFLRSKVTMLGTRTEIYHN